MKTLPRATAPFALLLALAASLSACGEDDEPDAAPDASTQTCRLAGATHASLNGPRAGITAGRFTRGSITAYETAMAQLSAAVSGEDEPDTEVTQAVLTLIGAYSRTRTFAEEHVDASSYESSGLKALSAAEVRLYGELVKVCPVLQGSDEE